MTSLNSLSPQPLSPSSRARFRDLLASEWIKTRSLRSTWWTITLTVVFVIGSSAVATLADGTYASGRAVFLPYVCYPPAGYWTLALVSVAGGALSVVSEYGTGLIRVTMVAVPARGSVVLAKAAVVAALWTVVGAVSSTGSFVTSQAVLHARHAAVPLTEPGVARAAVASALLAPVCALVGLGFGVLLRYAAATMVTSVFTLLMLPPMFSEGERWSAGVNHAMVLSAWKRLIQNWQPDPDSLGHTATVSGSWAVYAVWPLVAVALAVVVVRRRDV
ncbi:ABC transporter permease [Streptomyces sp. NPDC002566]|uniref:ABC transporter permease n=1 Tax=Streptomyces sp. NPDC002566 TaxID=3364650 RepID=UPI0036CD1C60